MEKKDWILQELAATDLLKILKDTIDPKTDAKSLREKLDFHAHAVNKLLTKREKGVYLKIMKEQIEKLDV